MEQPLRFLFWCGCAAEKEGGHASTQRRGGASSADHTMICTALRFNDACCTLLPPPPLKVPGVHTAVCSGIEGCMDSRAGTSLPGDWHCGRVLMPSPHAVASNQRAGVAHKRSRAEMCAAVCEDAAAATCAVGLRAAGNKSAHGWRSPPPLYGSRKHQRPETASPTSPISSVPSCAARPSDAASEAAKPRQTHASPRAAAAARLDDHAADCGTMFGSLALRCGTSRRSNPIWAASERPRPSLLQPLSPHSGQQRPAAHGTHSGNRGNDGPMPYAASHAARDTISTAQPPRSGFLMREFERVKQGMV
eukprot:353842-Chlamydomonas_euryale.AAC.5